MRSRRSISGTTISLMAGLALVALSLAVVGCAKKKKRSDLPVRTSTNVVDPSATPKSTAEAIPRVSVVPTPEPPRVVTFDEARSAYDGRRYDEAADLFGLYVEQERENAWGHYMLALSAWKSGDLAEAESAFEQALDLNPSHVKSMLNLGRVLLDSVRPQEALVQISAAIETDPMSGEAHRLQGRALHQLDQTEDAIASYREAILIDEDDAWSMNNMALVLIERERFDEALYPAARAVELRDDVAIFYNNLGIALERTGHVVEAKTAYESAVALDAMHERAAANLARVGDAQEDPAIEPVNLGELAAAFTDQFARWRPQDENVEEDEISATGSPDKSETSVSKVTADLSPASDSSLVTYDN